MIHQHGLINDASAAAFGRWDVWIIIPGRCFVYALMLPRLYSPIKLKAS